MRLNSTGLFWIRLDGDGEPGDRAAVLGVEAALNRLAIAARTLDPGADEAAWWAADAEALRTVADEAPLCLGASAAENPLLDVRGCGGRPGGEWDVRTRFARACERTLLPFRLEYRYDCSVAEGLFAVDFALPDEAWFPARAWDGASWRDVAAGRPAARARYGLRLAALLAATAFGTNVGVSRVTVTGCAGDVEGAPELSLAFDRIPFAAGALAAAGRGALSDPGAADAHPQGLLDLLAPARASVRFGADGGLAPVEPLETGLAPLRTELWDDRRELPDDLKGLLRADRACELDVYRDDDPAALDEVRAVVRDDAEETPLLAIAQLESVLERLGDGGEPDGGRAPLYCANALARLTVDVLGTDPATRYRKVPDALYDAHSALMRLYERIGDPERACAEGRECVRVAPTSSPAHTALSVHYAEAGRFQDAADELLEALRVCTAPSETPYIHYRLAFALWQCGRRGEALACYGLALQDRQLGDQARKEMRDLMDEMGVREAPDSAAAQATLRAAGIPAGLTDAVVDLAARAAAGLADAGFPEAAWPAASLLASVLPGGDDLAAVTSSLRYGVRA